MQLPGGMNFKFSLFSRLGLSTFLAVSVTFRSFCEYNLKSASKLLLQASIVLHLRECSVFHISP